jgi:hypothetical protein
MHQCALCIHRKQVEPGRAAFFCGHPNGDIAGGGLLCQHFQLAEPEAPAGANATQVGGNHYAIPIQTWDFITKNEIPFLEGNAIKYLVRHRSKGRKADLEKAIHYIQKAIEVYYP